MSINTQKIVLLFVLFVSLILIVSCGNQNGTATGPKIEQNQTRINWTDDGIGITIFRSDEPPSDGGTRTPAASPIAKPPN